MTVSKTYVADTCRRQQYLILETRRKLMHRVSRLMPRNVRPHDHRQGRTPAEVWAGIDVFATKPGEGTGILSSEVTGGATRGCPARCVVNQAQ